MGIYVEAQWKLELKREVGKSSENPKNPQVNHGPRILCICAGKPAIPMEVFRLRARRMAQAPSFLRCVVVLQVFCSRLRPAVDCLTMGFSATEKEAPAQVLRYGSLLRRPH